MFLGLAQHVIPFLMHIFHIKALYHNNNTYTQIARELYKIQRCAKHRRSPFAESFPTSYRTL